MQKQPLCRLCVIDGFGRPVRAKWHPEHWPTGLERLWVGRPGVCNNALLILLAPFVRSPGTCSDYLCKQVRVPYEGGENIQWHPPVPPTQGNSSFLESSHVSPVFSMQSLSLSCCAESGLMQKQHLHRLCVLSSFGRPVGARQVLMMPETLACWARVDSDKKARCTWLCPVNPVCSLCLKPKWAPGSVARNALRQSQRPKHLDRATAHPIEGESDINNFTHSTSNPRGYPQIQKSSRRGFPVSQLGLLLQFDVQKIFNQSLARVIALYVDVYFSVLVGGGEFSIFLFCCHLGSLSHNVFICFGYQGNTCLIKVIDKCSFHFYFLK